ncbi:MAG: hypothetical protein EXX96DRAFT_135021 [Benjaminiella poitrasii]|nr:MAG: hypothetical protein EXX96DRAFT_135021 [Benjaminiella poitrasii]
MSSLRIPRKRNPRRVPAKNYKEIIEQDQPIHVENKSTINPDQAIAASIENLINNKKRRLERQDTETQLSNLFSKLQQDLETKEQNGEYGAHVTAKDDLDNNLDDEHDKKKDIHLVQFDDEFLLQDKDPDEDEEEVEKKLKEAIQLYFDENAQENIDQAIKVTKHDEFVQDRRNTWYQDFFSAGSKKIREPCLVSRELGRGQKEAHLSELSSTSKGRAFLMQSGCMKDWHRSGWKCPNYIYQWIFEVVGLESNKIAAKNALSTLFALWSLPGNKIDSKLPHIYEQRYIEFKTFKSILLAYDAIPSQIFENTQTVSPEEAAEMMEANERKDNIDVHQTILPVSQLGWMIKAFSFSIRLWSKAYTTYEIRHTVRIILQVSLDKTGSLVLQSIQTSIDNCLSALNDATWDTELKMIANDVCDIVTDTNRQMHLFDAVKSIYNRSRLLRRVLAVTCLERCLEREASGSVDYISTDQTIIQQISQIFHHEKGFFRRAKENNNEGGQLDYEECYIRVAILDAAIGMDDEEIKRDKVK